MAKEIVIDIIDGKVSVSSDVQTGDTVAVIKAKNLPEEWLSNSTYVYALISQGKNQVLNLMQNETENSKTVKKCGVQSVFTANNKAFKIVIFGTNVEVGEDGTVSGSYRYVSAPVMVSVGEGIDYLTAKILPDKNGYEAISSILESLQLAVEAEKVRDIRENGGTFDNGTVVVGRVTAEARRVGAEDLRKAAELERGKAETERAKAETERVAAETARVSGEKERGKAEEARGSNEIKRMENEELRIAAEKIRSAMIETKHFASYEESQNFMDSVFDTKNQKFYKITIGSSAEEPDYIEWLICSYNPGNFDIPYFQMLINNLHISTRKYIGQDGENYIQKWSAWQTIVDDSRLESRLKRFADEFTVDVDQSYNANSENAQSGKAVAEAISTIVNASPDGGYVIIDQSYNALSENAQSGRAVAEAIANLVNGSPEALDTLHELANALGNDENFSATVMEEIGKKVSSSDYATNDIAGVVKAYDGDHGSYGVKINPNGKLQLDCAYGSEIRAKVSKNSPITPAYADVVVHSATHKEMSDDYDVSTLTLCAAENGKQGQYPASYDATKGYVDSKIGDIETALDGIITIQNGILGVGVNE